MTAYSSCTRLTDSLSFGMMNRLLLFGAGLFLLSLDLAQAVVVVGKPSVQAVNDSAVITWKTDGNCGTRVRYGLTPDKLDGKSGDGVGTEHTAQLNGLSPGTTYYYIVGTAKYELAKGEFTTSGKGSVTANTKPAKEVVKESPKPQPVAKKLVAPPTRKTWGNLPALQDHFARHGGDFNATSPDDYARQAWEFLQRGMDQGWTAKLDESDGSLRVYDPKTRAFAAYNRDGTTKTYFKPGGADYFQRQPGKLVKLKRPE